MGAAGCRTGGTRMNKLKKLMVTPPCPCCGGRTSVSMTCEQFDKMQDPNRGSIQSILPEVSPSIRERFVSGICGPCWEEMFAEGM